ncbi:Methyltransferase domain-containing protein [Kaistia soli DSM 19436]|uniref:Methyltransferase domain-containing protein n=1 Tax=Kaistia soli DSM 19436 TaxID=1122133 RepID=A0A1M5CXA0_9HYPH|nr:class I SAM-dependent methyltransferase [Kaistia soli]SHF59112.1 Methyltransferase domain-containing protein [Kaistia soli DSM 19436]
MTDDLLYADPELVRFYDWENPWTESFSFFADLVEGSDRVLDLGCGTGLFGAELARRGHRVTGCDPAGAMLDVARRRPDGEKVRWIEADARSLALDEPFDMIVMTGHAYQTLLAPADRASLFAVIARHLAPGGHFFFDSRNPEARAWELWTADATRATLPHPVFGMVERWNDVVFDAESGVVTYGTHYRLDDGRLFEAQSRIAFARKDEIEREIAAAGLRVDRWMGDYEGSPFTAKSREIIPFGSL